MRPLILIVLAASSLFLNSCATDPKKEGLIGPEVVDEEAIPACDRPSSRKDPEEINVDILKYKKKF